MKKTFLTVLFLSFAFVSCAVAKQPALGQFYACTGVDPSGDTYTVGLETKAVDGVTWFRQVTPAGTQVLVGQGFYNGNHFLGVEWFGGDPEHAGVIDYTIKGKKLEGKWKVVDDPKVYDETCVAAASAPQPKPAEVPDGATVSGSVKL
jgi:hypothetical protein